jgi:hypothetical protein
MTLKVAEPSARASLEELADWIELQALLADDRNASLGDLARVLHRSGSADDLMGEIRYVDSDDPYGLIADDERDEAMGDYGWDAATSVAEDTAAEIDDRVRACGGRYPFRMDGSVLRLKKPARSHVYSFLLLLSIFGHRKGRHGDMGPVGIPTLELFEEVSALAATTYLGGRDNGVGVYFFGFPRRRAPRGFKDALNELCREMGEGGGCKESPTRKDQKDAHLDLVVWRHFPDGRRGKAIGFGQLATGKNWSQKLSELNPHNFRELFMLEGFAVPPLRLFFMPGRVKHESWDSVTQYSGVVFDRCRLAALASRQDRDVERRCRDWVQHVLAQL